MAEGEGVLGKTVSRLDFTFLLLQAFRCACDQLEKTELASELILDKITCPIGKTISPPINYPISITLVFWLRMFAGNI